ncbi:MAG: DUF4331 domain-containing protein [Actinobacteria bacterium]|nr:DUF4331 domain-containing protein [Actinomycetota bacterium]
MAAALAAAVARGPAPEAATASSHREAPLITQDPTADNTDVYAFVSPDRPDSVTLIANWLPFQEPAGGPNFYNFDDKVRYEIHVDNDGDARWDITYRFRFRTDIRDSRETFLYNTGPITSLADEDWNLRQFYSVTKVTRGEGAEVIAEGLPVPPANIGPRSTPDYEEVALDAVRDLPLGVGGTAVFAGQRDDPFFVDVGSIFDLAGLRPFNPFHLIPLADDFGVDGVGGFNVNSIAIQVPISELAAAPNKTIGVYASASRQSIRVLSSKGRAPRTAGSWVQVSRLGNPLVNEIQIPLSRKDFWNSQDPADDAQFAGRTLAPEPAGLVNLLYPALPDTPTSGRDDLAAVFLTGIPTLNFTGPRQADLLRLNFTIPPAAHPSPLAVLEGDFQGWPNGRRLADDVTDIELRAVACGYGPILAKALGLCNLSPNNTLGDGVDENDVEFLDTFPYLGTPHQGYEHLHHAS